MRSFLLTPFIAATAVTALAVDFSGSDTHVARAALGPAVPVVARGAGIGSSHDNRRAMASGHKRMVRRRKCKTPNTTQAPPAQNTWTPPPTDGTTQQPPAENTWTSDGTQQPDTTQQPPAENTWTPQTDGTTQPPVTDGTQTTTDGTQPPVSETTATVPPTDPNANNGGGGQMTGDGALFPVQPIAGQFWTTSSSMGGAIPMQDALKVQSGKLPEMVDEDGQQALACTYNAGQYGTKGGGFGFYTYPEVNGIDITKSNHVLLSYSIKFAADFDFVKGGKLPGFYGGSDFESSKTCSGGSKRDNCFSARLMWRENGAGEIYNYVPPDAHNSYCDTKPGPMTTCNTSYGDSVGRGAWTFPKGEWVTIAQRVKLNDAGQANGEQEIFVNGESMLRLEGVNFRLDPAVTFQGIMAQTFFGGGDESYATTKEEHTWFKDWSIALLE